MNRMLDRTRSTLALGVAVVCVAAGSLAGAPTAAACPIDSDGNCLVTRPALRTSDATVKPKHAKSKKAPIRRSH